MIRRSLATRARELARQFPAVTITGPRQSGKTTLARMAFPKHPYASLEAPDLREFAAEDPRGFLAQFPRGAVLDEVQRVPQIASYLQEIMDALGPRSPARRVVVMSGSQLGKTETGLNWLGFLMHHTPGPTLLVRPTVEEARREAQRCLEEAMEGGGYVMVTGDEVPRDAKMDNLRAMVEVVEEQGRY